MKRWTVKFCVFSATVFVACSLTAQAKNLSSEAQLRKMKLNLIGELPTDEEYSQVKESDWTQLRQEKLNEYLATDAFAHKMSDRILDDIRLETEIDEKKLYNYTRDQNVYSRYIYLSRDHLDIQGTVSALIQEGKSWDEILASPQYIYFDLLNNDLQTLTYGQYQIDTNIKIIQETYQVSYDEAAQITLGLKPRPPFKPYIQAEEKLKQVIQRLDKFDQEGAVTATRLLKDSVKAATLLAKSRIGALKNTSTLSDVDQIYFDLSIGEIIENLAQVEPGRITQLSSPAFQDYSIIQQFLTIDPNDLKAMQNFANKIRNATEEAYKIEQENSGLFSMVTNLFNSGQIKNRFNQTRYSKTAAFYRIFFCDEMHPIALGTSTISQDALGGLRFNGRKDGIQTAQISSAEIENPHVHEKCVSCHRKLDPVHAQEENPEEKITLVYDDENGNEHKIEVENQNDLIPTAQTTDQYLTCQSRKIWKWVIGEDVPLSGNRLNEVRNIYKQEKGDLKKVVSRLIQSPEFSNDEFLFQPVNIDSVKPILVRCNSCHASENMMPSFTELPINVFATTEEQKKSQHFNWLAEIAQQTKFTHFGKMAKMPPRSANWILAESDHIRLGRWIWDLARDENNRPTITEEQRNLIFKNADEKLIQKLSRTEAEATFYDTWKRFIEKDNMLGVIQQMFPDYTFCANRSDQGTRSFLGYNDIMSGSPASTQPTLGFQSWYSTCMYSTVERFSYDTVSAMNNGLLEDSKWNVVQQRWNLVQVYYYFFDVGDLTQQSAYNFLMRYKWTDLTDLQKRYWVAGIVESHIGPQVLSSDDVQRLAQMITASLNSHYESSSANNTLSEALKLIVFMTLNTEEFLTF